MPKLLCLAASYRDVSANKKLLTLAAEQAQAHGAHIHRVDYKDVECPTLRDDGDTHTLPPGAAHMVQALAQADGMLLAMPEYNWSIPGGLKNLIDWVSVAPGRVLAGKTALLMCASPSVRGGISGLLQLRVPLEHLDMWVYPQVIGIGRSHEVLGPDCLMDEKEEAFLKACIEDYVKITRAIVTARA